MIGNAYSQILDVPEITQEQTEWCWAGVSKCVLDYYGYPIEQCQIADYTRQVNNWHNFGSTDCCEDASQGCNYWNYNWDYPGSIQDILVHFGEIQNYGTYHLSLNSIINEISSRRPFIIRWGWYSGGGHFVVGHGINDSSLYYMDPWFGEGLHISDYDWVIDDGSHTWTHTNVLTTSPISTSITNNTTGVEAISFYPNPADNKIFIDCDRSVKIIFYDVSGKKVLSKNGNGKTEIDISRLPKGIYTANILSNGKVIANSKIVKL